MKTRTKGEMGAAKTLCSPFEQPALPEGTKFLSKSVFFRWLEFISCDSLGSLLVTLFGSLNYYEFCGQVPNVLHLGSLQKNGATGAEATKLSSRVCL